jgi:hypothetical protein
VLSDPEAIMAKIFAAVLIVAVAAATAQAVQTSPPPTHVTGDALAFILQQEATVAGRGHSIVAAYFPRRETPRWYVDDKLVPRHELAAIPVQSIRHVRLDTHSRPAVMLYRSRPASSPPQAVHLQVIPSEIMSAEARKTNTLFLLGRVLVSGEDMARLGPRRAQLDRNMESVTIMRPAAVSRHVGVDVSVTFVQAQVSIDPRPLFAGSIR